MTRRHLLITSAILLALAVSCRHTQEITTEEPEPEIPAIGFFTDRYRADTVKVKSGETFSGIMNRLGMSAKDAYELSMLCDSVFDVRKLRAGNEIRAYYDPEDSTGVPAYAVYDNDKVRSTVFRCKDSLAVWTADKPVTREKVFTDVTINSSLWNDMIASGGNPNLIMELADIYQWSVNFFALQKGDRFRLIYTRTLCEGEVVAIDTIHFCLFSGDGHKDVAAVRFDNGEGGNNYWDKGGESLKRMFLKAPLKYNRISSRFSYARRHPVTGVVKAHTAVDYAAPTGTPVYAIGDGTVTKVGWDPSGGGNRIRLKHMQGYESCYMHLSKFAPGMKEGRRVSQGELIGYVGATGTATGPHLDFRIWEKGRPIDPLTLNSPASEPLAEAYRDAFDKIYDSYISQLDTLVATSGKATEEDATAGDEEMQTE